MQQRLTDIEQLKPLLQKQGIVLKRTSGQHFLICEEVVEATMALLERPCDFITELGAGAGTLTQALIGAGFQVLAIERDEHFIPLLKTCVPKNMRSHLTILQGDLRQTDWIPPAVSADSKKSYCLVGNIPYNLSGFIVRTLTTLEPAPAQVIFLVQREVADRLVASPPSLGLSTLAVQLWGKAQIVMHVPSDCFFPPPEVASALVLLEPRAERLDLVARERVLQTAKVFFQAKRKQVGGTLQKKFGLSSSQVAQILKHVGVTHKMRPQEIYTEQWIALTNTISRYTTA